MTQYSEEQGGEVDLPERDEDTRSIPAVGAIEECPQLYSLGLFSLVGRGGF